MNHMSEYRAKKMTPLATLCLFVFTGVWSYPSDAATWTDASPLNVNAAVDDGRDSSPTLVVGTNGMIVAAWQSFSTLGGTIGDDKDILFARSTDDGQSWSWPALLNSNGATDGTADDMKMTLATDGEGTWMAVWQSTNDLGGTIGTDEDHLFSVSVDDGLTWSTPTPVNGDASTDDWWPRPEDHRPKLATDGEGNWMVVWRAQKDPYTGADEDILFAVTSDLGQTWTYPAHVNVYGVADTYGDREPWVVAFGTQAWMVVWKSGNPFAGPYGGDEDIFVARTDNNGATWTVPAPVNSDAADADDERYGLSVGQDGQGSLMVVWSGHAVGCGGDSDIVFSASGNDGATWSDVATVNANAGHDSEEDTSPFVAGSSSDTWIAAWHSSGNIRHATSTDLGTTWSDPELVSSNGQGGGDARVVAVNAYRWIAAWITQDSLGGTIDTDFDILYCRATIPDQDADSVPDPEDNCPAVPNADQHDDDADGVGDPCDICSDTPLGDDVDSEGRSRGDLDGDCDVDLADFAIFQGNFSGPQ